MLGAGAFGMERSLFGGILSVVLALLVVRGAVAACTGDPQQISDGYWDCDGTPDGATCTANCRPGEKNLTANFYQHR